MMHLVPFAVARSVASLQVGDDEQGNYNINDFSISHLLIGQLMLKTWQSFTECWPTNYRSNSNYLTLF